MLLDLDADVISNMTPRPRLLVMLGQLPHDPASGAARSLWTIGKLMVNAGYTVRVLGTTASEHSSLSKDEVSDQTPLARARLDGLPTFKCRIRRPMRNNGPSEIEYTLGDMRHILMDTLNHSPWSWQDHYNNDFDQILARQLHEFNPDLVIGFGGSNYDMQRRHRIQASGTRFVLSLQNHGYFKQGALEHTDGIHACSKFLAETYFCRTGHRPAAIPNPLDWEEVQAENHEPIFVTFVNPSPEKGVMFFARLAEELAVRRPDIPMLVVDARSSGGALVAAGQSGGFDLRRHRQLMWSAGVAQPKAIFQVTRILLVPSVWPEPAGRVAIEALVNGVPPIVSNRGGLPETVGEGGFILSLTESLTPETTMAVRPQDVMDWLKLILRLTDDPAAYETARRKALDASRAYSSENLRQRYDAFLCKVLQGNRNNS